MKNIKKAFDNDEKGVYINIFVTPNSDKTLFPIGYNKWRRRIEMKTSSPDKKDQANLEVIKTISDFFEKPARNVLITSGKKSKGKKVLVKDISFDYAVGKVEDFIDGL